MIKIPPHIPPPGMPVPPKKEGKEEGRRVELPAPKAGKEALPLTAHGLAVKLALLAAEARERELSMAKIIEHAIEITGITNPQAAMEEIDRRLQKEIEAVLEEIKSNKELMEEAEAWEALGDLLESNLTKEQLEAFIGLVEEQIKSIK